MKVNAAEWPMCKSVGHNACVQVLYEYGIVATKLSQITCLIGNFLAATTAVLGEGDSRPVDFFVRY